MKITVGDTIMKDGKIMKVHDKEKEYKPKIVSDTIPTFVQDIDGRWIKNPLFVKDVDGKWIKNPDVQVECDN